jgi:tetratricopeptide (TPR) repeat protein
MARQPLAMSPNYLAVVRGIRELHRLTLSGRDESPEADAVRDATDGPWEGLSEAERKRASGLSEDLYSISEPPADGPREMNPQAQARLNDAVEARQRGEWDRALELLRRWGNYVSPALVSYLRGSIWLEAGDPETAVLFYEHASRLQPENGNYLAIFLHTLDAVDPPAARRRAQEILKDPDRYPPVAVARAADVMFKAVRSLPGADAAKVLRELIPPLDQTVSRIEKGDEGGVDRSSYAMAVGLLGLTHEALGETQAALDCYSRGLGVDPFNDGLLVARGTLLYGGSPRAIGDFELAIRGGSPVVWPYFFLAHHYLLTRRYEECRAMCERASRLPASSAVRSELAEWTAIAQAEQTFPAEIVRASFENAIRLDPSNDRARRNLAAFEAATPPARARTWETRSESAVRTSGQAERLYLHFPETSQNRCLIRDT